MVARSIEPNTRRSVANPMQPMTMSEAASRRCLFQRGEELGGENAQALPAQTLQQSRPVLDCYAVFVRLLMFQVSPEPSAKLRLFVSACLCVSTHILDKSLDTRSGRRS